MTSSAAGSRYVDSTIELYRSGPRTVVKRRATGRFFEVESEQLPDLDWAPARPRTPTALFALHLTLLVSGVVGGAVLAGVVSGPAASVESHAAARWWVVAGYIAVQTVVHEGAHLVALHSMGRRADKVGFKLNFWVFPAFYVRMNDVLLLPRRDRVVVHSAGLLVNGTINLAVIASCANGRAPAVAFATLVFTPGLVANSLPLLRSDGHKTLLAALDINERRRVRDNPPLVRVLHAASWAVAAVTTVAAALHILP